MDSILRANEDRFFPALLPGIPVILGRPSKLSPKGRGRLRGTKRSEETGERTILDEKATPVQR